MSTTPDNGAASPLSQADLERFRAMLLEERERLMRSVQNITDDSRESANYYQSGDIANAADAGTDSFELDTSLIIADAELERLRDIESALERIGKGVYGICEGSGEPIPRARLEVFPAARYTVAYQEQLEKEGLR